MRPHLNPDPRAVAIALFIVVVALAVTVAYLIRQVAVVAHRADHHEQEAGHWRARYYTAANDRDVLARRSSQLTAALRTTTELLQDRDQPAWMQMLAPWEAGFLTGEQDLPAADVTAFLADVERHANSDQEQ